MRDAVAGRGLADADAEIEAGRVVAERTGEPVRWHPAPMVLAVSDRLKALVQGPSYAAALERARDAQRLLFRGETP